MLDAMSIKKAIQYDNSTGLSTGFVNLGDNIEHGEEATEVLVFMIVGLRGHWKAPVAYFFTHTLQASTQQQLVLHTISRLREIGVQVCALTMDGHAMNVAMCSLLGCQLDPAKHMKTYFYVEGCSEPIYVFMDACHMIKLVRNMVQACRVIKAPSGEVRWRFIELLHQQQQDLGLRTANRSQRHVDFQKQKMKVNLAVQTISDSVAKALQFLLQMDLAQTNQCKTAQKHVSNSI